MPRVSIIIPTFNLARYIGRTLESVFAQTYTDYEVIVIDDGSTDETREVLAHYAGKLRYHHQMNKGVAAARNEGLTQAAGELIAYLDADDMWYPQKLERQVDFLDRQKQCWIVHSDTAVIDETDRTIYSRFNQQTKREVPQGQCVMTVLRHGHIQPLTVLERRECLERTGGFDERLRGVDDYMRWVLLAIDGVEFGYIDEPLAMYRWRAGQFSHTRCYRQAFVMMLELLLTEKGLQARCGKEAADVVRNQLYTVRRDLAYLDRTEGRSDDARRQLLGLIREWPLRAELYVDLLKCVIPCRRMPSAMSSDRPYAQRTATRQDFSGRNSPDRVDGTNNV
jgi:glycosyltransferase involved in cell wall biosynthesis